MGIAFHVGVLPVVLVLGSSGTMYESSVVLKACRITESLPASCLQPKYAICSDEVLVALERMRSMYHPFRISKIVKSFGLQSLDEKRDCLYYALRDILKGIYISERSLELMVKLNQDFQLVAAEITNSDFLFYYRQNHIALDPLRLSRCHLHKWYLGMVNAHVGHSVSSLGLRHVVDGFVRIKNVKVYLPRDADIHRMLGLEIDRIKRSVSTDNFQKVRDKKRTMLLMEDGEYSLASRILYRPPSPALTPFQLAVVDGENHRLEMFAETGSWEQVADPAERDLLLFPSGWPVEIFDTGHAGHSTINETPG